MTPEIPKRRLQVFSFIITSYIMWLMERADMQVHAIYEDGRLTFQEPICLNTSRIELDVFIPDNCILHDEKVVSPPAAALAEGNSRQQILAAASVNPQMSATKARLDAILGKWRHHGGTSGKDTYKAIRHAEGARTRG
jgi:hypothetical protein